MALLPILEFPDPRLRTRAQPVNQVDDAIRTLIDDMFQTMYAAPGIGLAATQVNVHKRVIVIDVTESHDQPVPQPLSREQQSARRAVRERAADGGRPALTAPQLHTPYDA